MPDELQDKGQALSSGSQNTTKICQCLREQNILDDVAEGPPHYHELRERKTEDSALGSGRNFIPCTEGWWQFRTVVLAGGEGVKDREITSLETALGLSVRIVKQIDRVTFTTNI